MISNSGLEPPGDPRSFLEEVLAASTEYSMIATDTVGKILLWNEGARRIYGYSSDQILGKDFRRLNAREEVPGATVDRSMETALAQGKWEGMVRRRRANGEEFPAHVVLTVLRSRTGDPQGFLIISKDATTEDSLNRVFLSSRMQDRGLVGESLDALITTDTLGIITDVDTRAEELTGQPRERLVGTEFKNHVTDPSRAESGLREVLSSDRVTSFQLTLKGPEGRQIDAAFQATPIRGTDGNVRGVLAAARDITEQNRIAAELQVSQNYSRGLIESSPDAIVTIDAKGVITDANRQMVKATGANRDQLVGAPFASFFTDPGRAAEGIQRTLEHGSLFNLELGLRSTDSRVRTVSFNASTFRDASGAVRGVLASARDITEQLELDSQLRESRNYNRSLIEASPDALFVVDPNLSITDLNEGMVKITGSTREDLRGTSVESYFTDTDRAAKAIRQTLETGSLSNFELTLRTRAGGQRLVALNASTFGDAKGEVKGVVASVRDISEQKALESQLRQSESYNRGLVESNSDGLITTDLEGRITDVNKQMEQLSGLAREQLIGLPLKDLVTEPTKAEEAIRRVIRENRVSDFELRIRTPTGVQTDVSYNAATVRDPAGRLQGIIAAARDITEPKRLREELEQRNGELVVTNQRVREATRLKSEFLASMSHELRTPLNSIIGFSEYLLSQEDAELTAEQREYLTDILNSGNHLLQLINDVLDLARVESGKLELTPEIFSPARAVEEVCSILKPLVAEKRLWLHTEVDPLVRAVTLDPLRFKQILYNLMSNAVKFTPESGRVDLRLLPHGEEMFAIQVSDTGIGIAAADLPRLFREFEQLDAGPGRRYTGSGLGLSLTKKLAELQGGAVEVVSQLGHGSTFTVILPYVSPADADVGEPVPMNARILIVEDNPMNLKLVRVLLEKVGFVIEAAVDSESAEKMIREHSPDLILMDVGLPGKDGYSFTKELRTRSDTRDIPILIVTSFAMKGDRAKAFEAGCSGYLTKPINRTMLIDTVRRLLSGTFQPASAEGAAPA